MNRKLLTFLFAASLAGLAGCAANKSAAPSTSAPSAPASASGSMLPGGKSCDAQPAQNLVGQAFSDSVGADVRSRSGSDSVRVLKPGQVMTLEYNPARVNIIIDGQGRISAIRCG
ncbi:I78 family peptidase inhibitor [Bordetella hinzii]|uniref:I78 family peptidase inhibitor n=1 Tax=Bordetella hinzii TaxID=103855 RepID=UPI00045A3DB3|nr:I78 family peptidase inhibitor [Bordetella hinzii]KCB51475.1 peptidase inhibitor I78 family protein [Bordetella hinzii 1277]